MVIKSIDVHNFKSIYDELHIDFSQVSGFWKIEGAVGTGKTSIGEAIVYGLFGDIKGKNNRDLISWGEKDGCVTIECISKGHNLVIRRAIRGELVITVDGDELVYTNKNDAQHKLETEYYDISRMTLELLCIISFNNFKSLSNMSPKETRAFLDDVFGFSLLTNYANIAKENKKLEQNALSENLHKHTNITAQIKKIEDISRIARINDDKSFIMKRLEEIKNESAAILETYNADRAKHTSKKNALHEELSKIKTLGINKAKEIQLIESGICPTCGAKIDSSQLSIKLEEKRVLQESYKSTSAQISALDKEFVAISSAYTSANAKLVQEHNQLLQRKAKLDEQDRRAKIDLTKIKELKEQECVVISEKASIERAIEEWDQLVEYCGITMRQKVLGDFISVLNAAILDYTRKLNLPYTVEFNEEFECIIKLFSLDREISIRSLSTGQLKTVDMCIILGILRVIFSGVNFNVMFLDELFSNMDAELRSQICDVLKKELKSDRTIFVVSHQEISGLNFDGEITASLNYDKGKEKSLYTIKKY